MASARRADARLPGELCAKCFSPLVVISFVQDDTTMTMASCGSCHTRSWWRDGIPVALPEVLAAVVASRPPPPLPTSNPDHEREH